MRKVLEILYFSFVFCFCLPQTGFCYSISNISLSPDSPASLSSNEPVSVNFDYYLDVESLIWTMPYTNGAKNSNFMISPSNILMRGFGTTSRSFRILFFSIEDATVVDQIKFHIVSASDNQVVYESFIDVNYVYDTPTPTPVPGAIWLFGSGLAGLVVVRKRNKSQFYE